MAWRTKAHIFQSYGDATSLPLIPSGSLNGSCVARCVWYRMYRCMPLPPVRAGKAIRVQIDGRKRVKAIVLCQFGSPEVLRLEEVPAPVPGPGEVLLKVHAVSVNRTLDLGRARRPVCAPAEVATCIGRRSMRCRGGGWSGGDDAQGWRPAPERAAAAAAAREARAARGFCSAEAVSNSPVAIETGLFRGVDLQRGCPVS